MSLPLASLSLSLSLTILKKKREKDQLVAQSQPAPHSSSWPRRQPVTALPSCLSPCMEPASSSACGQR
ncbi:unnamed protein product [Nyctereutes procyonoides]|uniref:(raccoon dog) hypothetical protein n=1 Tax=Nyctereutes procyonoides TaxID=34880 RepID=A0A811Z446_NYCPR|nr:unnamed protein product [Nyctereutes procyonoides]